MNLAPTILGQYAVKQLEASASEAVLQVGKDALRRSQLAKVGCFNFAAARNLSKILKPMQVPSLKYLFEHVPPASLALPHMGVVSLAVLGAAFEAAGIGGSSPLEAWVRSHAKRTDQGVREAMVTFHTLKVRELAEASREKTATTDRRRVRRGKAHKLRVARFTARQPQAASA